MQILTDRNQKEIKLHGTYEFPIRVSHEHLSDYERGSFMWHWHPELEWTYVLEGMISYQVNQQIHILKPGQALLCNSNMPHTGHPVDNQDCHYVSITFHPRLLEGYQNSFLKKRYADLIIENPSLPCLALTLSEPWHEDILCNLKKIESLYHNQEQEEDFDFQIYLLLMEVWRVVCRHVQTPGSGSADARNTVRLKQILAYIHEHYQEKITLDDISAEVNICASECCRFFKNHMRESLFDYLLNYRIEQSLTMLAKGNYTITEIAVQCGFSTPSYFSRVFREQMGYSPREYQKLSHRKNKTIKIGGKKTMFQKVIVIGCPGAGKSTFSRKLRDKTGLPLYYLDMLWHKPDQTTVSREEFDHKLNEILIRDRWILDGNYNRTLELRLQACDTVFLLDLPVAECLAGAASRIGKPREDLPWTETEFDEEFRQWILDFPQNEMPVVYELISKYKDTKNIIVFHSRNETENFFQETFG